MKRGDDFFASVENVPHVLLVCGHGAMDEQVVAACASGGFELGTVSVRGCMSVFGAVRYESSKQSKQGKSTNLK